ncbi:peroxisome- protein [Agyrium rufum]|nr:peroxisome- protein [Agyrium rufum]
MSSTPKTPTASSGKSSSQDPNPTTFAAFSPARVAANKQRSTILVQQKSPLLIASPPQITRALAFSHPFILPLNKLVGLLSWSSGDPWESFLLVGTFWLVVLYGGIITRWSGPLVVVLVLILGMYSRRYSPLSSTGWTGEKVKAYKREDSESKSRHQKSLEEIVDTLNTFTSRCNVLLEPLIQLTDFLSTAQSATSATTRPALTALLLRILMITPLWAGLSLPPLRIITAQRVVLATGTLILSWHSRPARVSRTLLWRSATIRRVVAFITGIGLQSTDKSGKSPPLPKRKKSQHDIANSIASTGSGASTGVRFTFVLYENQRRWLGLGWTSSMFAYERTPWTDEHLNPSPPKEDFQLPDVENDSAKWRWVAGQDWWVDGTGKGGNDEWIYYDNKWNEGRRGQDGWGRYTRRRRWIRDAELVEVAAGSAKAANEAESEAADGSNKGHSKAGSTGARSTATTPKGTDSTSNLSKRNGAGSSARRSSKASGGSSAQSGKHSIASSEDYDHPQIHSPMEREHNFGFGDDMNMNLS